MVCTTGPSTLVFKIRCLVGFVFSAFVLVQTWQGRSPRCKEVSPLHHTTTRYSQGIVSYDCMIFNQTCLLYSTWVIALDTL